MDTNKGGGGTQKDHVMGTWGGGGLVWVQICPRGLFTAPNKIVVSFQIDTLQGGRVGGWVGGWVTGLLDQADDIANSAPS